MAGKKLEEGRELARTLAAFGMPFGRVLDYAEWVQLVLNVELAEYRLAVATARGVGAAHGTGNLGTIWAEAMAIDASEVPELIFEINSARHLSRVRHKLGFS